MHPAAEAPQQQLAGSGKLWWSRSPASRKTGQVSLARSHTAMTRSNCCPANSSTDFERWWASTDFRHHLYGVRIQAERVRVGTQNREALSCHPNMPRTESALQTASCGSYWWWK